MKQYKIYFLLLILILSSCSKTPKNYLQFVDMTVGTSFSSIPSTIENREERISGQTIIAAGSPFAMTQYTVQYHSTEMPCNPPYYFGTVHTHGFRATHWLSGACDKDYGSVGILPTKLSEEFKFLPDRRQTLALVQNDVINPAYLAVGFPDLQLMAEVTGTKRCGIFRFSWFLPDDPTLLITINNDDNLGYIKVDTEMQEIVGYNPVNRKAFTNRESAGISGFFVIKFDQVINKFGTFGNFDIEHGSTENKDQRQMGAYVSFQPEEGKAVKMKIGTSFTSIENARQNLETEIKDWNFDAMKEQSEKEWNELLGTIEVESEDTTDIKNFYTSLYHSLLQPRLYSDANGDYPAFSQQYEIKNTQDFEYYGDFSAWDIHRAQMPLLSLVAPKQYNDMVKSIVEKAKDGGWLPTSTRLNSYSSKQTGDYLTSILTDAAIKGFDFDKETALQLMLKNATQIADSTTLHEGKGRAGLESYLNFGYIPLDETSGQELTDQVTRTLDYAFNDWCIAQIAEHLEDTETTNNFDFRALNYSNVFDDEAQLMNGRYGDGSFFEGLQPQDSESFFSEGTAYKYLFQVPHDVPGLIDLVMGDEAFNQKLDQFLQSSDYFHADPGSHHVPFLYNYTGNWDKTQETVKRLLNTRYKLGPGGLAGRENAGQLSAWYVFGAMGFYPVCPGSDEYQLSSPLFEKITVHLDKEYYPAGKLVLESDQNAKNTIYQNASLNGDETGTILKHSEIKKGATLKFYND